MRLSRAGLAAVIVLLSAAALSACGSSEASLERSLASSRNATTQLLERKDVLAQPAGSPQRTFFAAWRALQFQDPRDVIVHLTGPLVRDKAGLEEKIIPFASSVMSVRPKVKAVHLTGTSARLDVTLTMKERAGANSIRLRHANLILPLVHGAGGWRLVITRPVLNALIKATPR